MKIVDALRRHMETHMEKTFGCDQCKNSYSTKTLLLNHGKKVHSAKVECPICKMFLQKSALNNHMKRHKSIKNFKCDHCPASFSEKYELPQHMWKHRKDHKFTCKVCKKGFNYIQAYKRHLLKH